MEIELLAEAATATTTTTATTMQIDSGSQQHTISQFLVVFSDCDLI